MDSCVCATLAARDCEPAALHISYSQRTESRERDSFQLICDQLGIQERLIVRNEALKLIGGSALTDERIQVPDSHSLGRDIPVTYVPFRNAHFLAVAVSWAEVLGASKIYIGAVEQDSSGYPDCRPAYYEAFNNVIAAGTKSGGIEIVTPLIAMFCGGLIAFSVLGCWHQDRRKLALGAQGFREFAEATPFFPFTGRESLRGVRELSPIVVGLGIGATIIVRYFQLLD